MSFTIDTKREIARSFARDTLSNTPFEELASCMSKGSDCE